MTIKQIDVGQDSFLDIVANLVGILIILVVVIGAQAKNAWDNRPAENELKDRIASLGLEISESDTLLVKLKADNDSLENKITREVQLANEESRRRHQVLVGLQLTQQEIASRRAELQQAEQASFDRNSRLADLRQELAQLGKEISALNATQVRRGTIEHYPTPIAKTVFADEVHFRLSHGQISFVPMDELIELMKSEWSFQAKKLTTGGEIRQMIGPIEGYRLQYELESFVSVDRSGPQRTRKGVRFKRFVMFPVNEESGESVEQCLVEGSNFRRKISRFRPENTTVSIWVYPDSYAELNQLKPWLREQGYQIANWPLSRGKQISGGPDGFQSAAQ